MHNWNATAYNNASAYWNEMQMHIEKQKQMQYAVMQIQMQYANENDIANVNWNEMICKY